MKSKITINFCAYLCWLLVMVFYFSGCATEGKSVGLGGAIGAGAGAGIGAIADPGKNGEYRTRNIIIGSALGGMAGMITGAAVHDATETKKSEAYMRGKMDQKSQSKAGAMPELKNAKVEAHWVEGRVMGNKYVDGHFEYVIVEPARWDVEE